MVCVTCVVAFSIILTLFIFFVIAYLPRVWISVSSTMHFYWSSELYCFTQVCVAIFVITFGLFRIGLKGCFCIVLSGLSHLVAYFQIAILGLLFLFCLILYLGMGVHGYLIWAWMLKFQKRAFPNGFVAADIGTPSCISSKPLCFACACSLYDLHHCSEYVTMCHSCPTTWEISNVC